MGIAVTAVADSRSVGLGDEVLKGSVVSRGGDGDLCRRPCRDDHNVYQREPPKTTT